MWKRRAEIAALALLILLACGGRPHVDVTLPEVAVTLPLPDRIDGIADVGAVALTIAVRLLD